MAKKKMTVYEVVTNHIMERLKEGTAPWRMPFKPGQLAMNWFTGKPYRGVNLLLTAPNGEYATKKQILAAGGKIKAGQERKNTIVVFFTNYVKKDEERETEEVFPVLKFYPVWEINYQCEGLTSKRPPNEAPANHSPIEAAEALIQGYINKPEIVFKPGQAFYHRAMDLVSVPPMSEYEQPEEYYSTLFHELVHSSGSPDRLNRVKGKRFGDGAYSREELVAEMGAAMLCGLAGIEQPILDNSAAYIANWLQALKNDHSMVVMAANAAQKAVDYMTGAISKDIQQSA